MKAFFIKYRQLVINGITLLLLVMNLINFYFIFEVVPQSNDECLWLEKKGDNGGKEFYFDLVKFEGVTWEAGIRDNDELKEINGIEITSLYKATVILNSLSAGEYAEYTVEREGYEFTTKVYIKKLINFYGLGLTLLSFFWVLVGHIVILARPEGNIQRQFYRLGILFSFFALISILNGTIGQNPLFEYPGLFISVDVIYTFGAVLLPFALIRFFWSFPKEFNFLIKIPQRRKFVILPLLLFVVTIILKYIYLYSNFDNYGIFKFQSYFVGMLGIALITGLVSLFINYFRLTDSKERNSIFVILISYAIGVGVLIYTSFFASILADTIFNNPEYYIPIILISVLPVSFGYSIFKYSLMDVSDVVKNTIIYGAATITIAAVYFFLIYFIGQSVSSAFSTEYQGVVAGIVFIIFAFIFQSTKDKFQDVITAKFYPEQFAYQKVLIQFNNDISGIVGLDNILDEIKNTFIESLRINKFAIALKTTEKGNYQLIRKHGIKELFEFKILDSMIIDHIHSKQKFHQPISISSHQFEEVIPGMKSILENEEIFTVIPLAVKNSVIGLFLFGLKYSGAQFAGKDLELLCAAANQTAVSLENARLYESEAQKIKMERDLENARRIQQNLLPQSLPRIDNVDLAGKMIPAMHIGGDYFDIIKICDEKILIVIGDVSGKGLPASFYMSKLQTMVRFYSKTMESPKQILEEINKGIFGEIDRNTFITASIALVDIKEKVIRFCRAGHTELICAGCNGNVKKIVPKGIGLGLEKGEIFNTMLEEMSIPLVEESVFLLFSDGISEAMNSKNELFGIERIIHSITQNTSKNSENILSSLIGAVSDFRGHCEQNDDITAVVLKYKSS